MNRREIHPMKYEKGLELDLQWPWILLKQFGTQFCYFIIPYGRYVQHSICYIAYDMVKTWIFEH